MLPVDMPIVQVQEPPIVLVQAATRSAAPAPEYILKTCEEVRGSDKPEAAMSYIDPASLLAVYMQNATRKYVDISAIRNVSLLKDAEHGKVISETAPSGRLFYQYKPAPKYQGNDRVAFMAEYAGRRFRINIELHVFLNMDGKRKTTCYPPQLITVKKPGLGLSEYPTMATALRVPPEPENEGG